MLKACVVFCLCYAVSLPAATIISASFPPGGTSSLYALQALWVSWSQTESYDNIEIAADLTAGSQSASGNAYLTNAIGVGASSANLIASSSYALAAMQSGNTTLFSGLTLGPGTYYLTLWSPCFFNCSGGGWMSAEGAVVVGPGVTNNGGFLEHGIDSAFPPATDFTATGFGNMRLQSAYLVTGMAAASLPEPVSWEMAGLGILAFGLALWRRHHHVTKHGS